MSVMTHMSSLVVLALLVVIWCAPDRPPPAARRAAARTAPSNAFSLRVKNTPRLR